MNSQINSFELIKLHGYKSLKILFEDNTIIIVGENGTGKTTVLRLLFYLLSGQWNYIAQYKFDKLIITIDDISHELTYNIFEKNILKLDNRILHRLPSPIRHGLLEMIEKTNGKLDLHELEYICEKYEIPMDYILDEFNFNELQNSKNNSELVKKFNSIKNSFKSQILYLPTYRRIEQELSSIFKGIDYEERNYKRRRFFKNEKKMFVELIEFGMKDVEYAISNTLEKLKDFARENLNKLTLGYLGDVVDQKYSEVNITEVKKTSEEIIKNVLERIHESILSNEQKEHLFEKINSIRSGGNLDEHAKVLCHYFLKLLNFQQDLQKKETFITNFCNVCNEYMEDKNFIYDKVDYSFSIISDQGKKIKLRHLSSGEKQIVSLFSHLYLSSEKNFFVLIDEPELSLSVPWQRRFLIDIKNGGFCSGLFAVTHSPFIYENELAKYAHGINEFEI